MKLKTNEELWWCRAGHALAVIKGTTEAFCPKPGHRGTNEMKSRALYPSWGPDEPPTGEGRLCCRSYHDEPHVYPCRFSKREGSEHVQSRD